jgi:acyl-CoA synthetase (AMP-forming)/AMP-acid ligase II
MLKMDFICNMSTERNRVDREASFVDQLRGHARVRPHKLALRVLDKGVSPVAALTYAELDGRACAVAAQLQRHRAFGERALLLLPTCADYVTGFLGALYAGAIVVPAFPPESQRRQHLERLASLARDAQPRFVLTSSRELPRLRGLIEFVPELAAAELIALDVLDPCLASDYVPPALGPETLAFLQYTSGSLASPKGVMVSHGNLLANERAIAHALAFQEHDVMVTWLPLFHDMGLIGGLLQPLFSGASVVLMSPLRFLERPLRWLEAISDYRGTISGGPDFAYRMCVDRIEPAALAKLDLRSWRLAFCGSEPIRESTLRTFAQFLTPSAFSPGALYPCYGLAEATLFVSGVEPGSCMRVSSPAPAFGTELASEPKPAPALVSCGAPPPQHAVLIADPGSAELLAEGQVGEICVSGPSIAQGYWRNQAATDAAFVTLAGRRALRTGDLGFERDGQLHISGRLKDLIIVRGRNIVPQDVEDQLAGCVSPLQLGRIAAFSLQTAQGEAIGVAAELSRAAARSMRPEALCEAISAAVHDCVEEPARLIVLLAHGGLPRTSSGKLRRSACAERLQSGDLSPLAVYRDGVLQMPPSAATSVEVP